MLERLAIKQQARRHQVVRWASSGIIGLALACFLLFPLVSVSCAAPRGYGSGGGGVTAAYTGVTLATGGEPRVSPTNKPLDPAASTAEDHVQPQLLVAAGLILVIAAFVVSLSAGYRLRNVTVGALAILAAFGTVVGVLRFRADLTDAMAAKLARISPDSLANFTAKYGRDHLVEVTNMVWLVTALLLLAAGINLLVLVWSPHGSPDEESASSVP
jgi:small-conductance mechanosensitive channel